MTSKIRFETVKKYQGQNDLIPRRATTQSAGYDMVAAEDYVIQPYIDMIRGYKDFPQSKVLSLDNIACWTKQSGLKPTLISTGVKVYLNSNQYLKLVSRSSSPLKYWLVCANSVGIIDADYVDNGSNEGEVFFQVINFSPFPIQIKRGDKICQGIICTYDTVTDDNVTTSRVGGFGSTSVNG